MAAIILPDHWRRQPTGPVELRDDGLASGIVAIIAPVPGDPYRILGSGGLPLIRLGSGDIALRGDGASMAGVSLPVVLGDEISLFAAGRITRAAGVGVNVAVCSSAGDQFFGAQFSTTGGSSGRVLHRQSNGGTAAVLNYTAPQTVSFFDYATFGATSLDTGSSLSLQTYWQGQYDSAVSTPITGTNASYNRFSLGGAWRSSSSYAAAGNDMAIGIAFNRILSPAEYAALHENPWQVYKRSRRVLYFGGDTPPNIAPQSGSVLCAGGVPGVEQSLALAPSAGTVVWAGGVPVVSQARAVQPAAGAFAWAGSAPGLAQPQAVSPSAGAAQWAGGVPGIVSGRAVAPAAGAVAWGGYAPAVAQPNGVAPTAGAVVWSGSVPGVVSGRAIAPAAGAVAWAGEAPGIAQPRTVAPSAGAVVWAGGVPTVGLANLVEPADGGIVWMGGLPGIAQARAVSPGAGAAAWIGGVPGVEAGRAVRPAGGAASWSGHAPGIGQPRTVAPVAASVRWLGNAPYVGAINLVRPDPGAIVFAGRVPGIAQPRTVSPLPGAVRWAGGMPGIGDLLGRPEAVRAVIRERFILTVAAERRILRS